MPGCVEPVDHSQSVATLAEAVLLASLDALCRMPPKKISDVKLALDEQAQRSPRRAAVEETRADKCKREALEERYTEKSNRKKE